MPERIELSSSTTSEDAGGEAGSRSNAAGSPSTPIRACKMIKFRAFATREEALQAAGLSE